MNLRELLANLSHKVSMVIVGLEKIARGHVWKFRKIINLNQFLRN